MRFAWLTLFTLFPLVFACSKDKSSDATQPGATVLSWELAKSDRDSIRAAKVSDTKALELEYEGSVSMENIKVKVKVHLETATVEFEEDGKPVTHRAPVKLRVEAVDANGFTLSQGKCMGPHYTMDIPPARDMILHCVVEATKPRYDVSFTIYAHGDGHIDDGKAKP